MIECLDDNAVTAFVARRMSAAERAEVISHLSTCEVCLTITSAAAAGSHDEGQTSAAPVALSDEARLADTLDPDAPMKQTAVAATLDSADGESAANAAMDATVPFSAPAVPTRLPRGEKIAGRYTLRSMIGEGAMGVVYVADDPQLDRKVALKIVRSARFSQREARARLSREARAMAQVKHPNVVMVYDAGELDDGVFIAMELVTGETLADWVARGRGWRDVVKMYLAAGRGLAAAHDAGLVHRDFKPENVLVDRGERACVTDFGLAFAPAALPRATSSSELAQVPLRDVGALTRTGALVGTPLYMSPEQHRGERVDARSDQYSFAVALYMALYGLAPFGGSTVGELRSSVMGGSVAPRPSGTAVPVRVHRVLLRALASRPEARYPSIGRMLDELVIAIRPPWWQRRLTRAIAAGAAACVATGMAMLAVSSGGERVPVPAPAPAVSVPVIASAPGKPRRTVVVIDKFEDQAKAPLLEGALELQIGSTISRSTKIDSRSGRGRLGAMIAELGLPATATGVEIARAQSLHDGTPTLSISGHVDQVAGGLELTVVGVDPMGVQRPFVVHETAAGLDDAMAAAMRAGAVVRAHIDRSVTRDGDRLLTRSLEAVHEMRTGQGLASNGQYVDGYAHLKHAVELDPDLALAHYQLGTLLYNLQRPTESAAEYEAALKDRDSMPERLRLTVLGSYLNSTEHHMEAVAAFEELLTKWPGDLETEINVVASALDGGSWPLALELARRAAGDHPEMAVVRANLVLAELASSKLDDALRDGRAMAGELPHPTPAGLAFLAITQAMTGDPVNADHTIDRIVDSDAMLALNARIDLRMYSGRLRDAEELLRQQLDQALHGGDANDVSWARMGMARVLLRRGDHAGARRIVEGMPDVNDVRPAYLAASTLCDVGDDRMARQLARTWGGKSLPEPRMLARLLDGDVARMHGDLRAAIAAYEDAVRSDDMWIAHARLGLAQLASGAFSDAVRELELCIAHRGQAAVFATPTARLLPEIYLALARAKDGAHDAGALDAYRAVVALAPDAQGDTFTDAARQRISQLAK